jgi:hypothetical protein
MLDPDAYTSIPDDGYDDRDQVDVELPDTEPDPPGGDCDHLDGCSGDCPSMAGNPWWWS